MLRNLSAVKSLPLVLQHILHVIVSHICMFNMLLCDLKYSVQPPYCVIMAFHGISFANSIFQVLLKSDPSPILTTSPNESLKSLEYFCCSPTNELFVFFHRICNIGLVDCWLIVNIEWWVMKIPHHEWPDWHHANHSPLDLLLIAALANEHKRMWECWTLREWNDIWGGSLILVWLDAVLRDSRSKQAIVSLPCIMIDRTTAPRMMLPKVLLATRMAFSSFALVCCDRQDNVHVDDVTESFSFVARFQSIPWVQSTVKISLMLDVFAPAVHRAFSTCTVQILWTSLQPSSPL